MSTDDVRDQVDGSRAQTHHLPIPDPAQSLDLVADSDENPQQWTLSETHVTDFYTKGRWLTVTDEELVMSLEDER